MPLAAVDVLSESQPPFLPKPFAAALNAVIYDDGREIEGLLACLADALISRGFRLAGIIQRSANRDGRANCDMVLQDLATGISMDISEDRGPGARGCKLDVAALLDAGERVKEALDSRPDLLVLNKYGKTEHEGGGLRPLIGRAVELDIPVLIAVPRRNISSWDEFAGGLYTTLSRAELRAIADASTSATIQVEREPETRSAKRSEKGQSATGGKRVRLF